MRDLNRVIAQKMISERFKLIYDGVLCRCRNAKGSRHTGEHAVAFDTHHRAPGNDVASSCERKRDQLTALLRETIKIIAMVEDLVGEEQT